MKHTNRIHAVIVCVMFSSLLIIPLAYDLFSGASKAIISNTENRYLAQRPKLNPALLDPFPKAYENYYNDNFFFRTRLLGFNNIVIDYKLFSRSPLPAKVVPGSHGWFYKTEMEYDVYTGDYMLSQIHIDALVKELQRRAIAYRKSGIRFYVTIAPMKCEIYPEFLPPYYCRSLRSTFTDEVSARLEKDSLVHFIPLKAALLRVKKEATIYYRTDNHWNGLGAWVVYQEIINRISTDFPEVTPVKRRDFWLTGWRYMSGNLTAMIGLAPLFNEMIFYPLMLHPKASVGTLAGYPVPKGFSFPDQYEVVRQIPGTKLPKALVIRGFLFHTHCRPFQRKLQQNSMHLGPMGIW